MPVQDVCLIMSHIQNPKVIQAKLEVRSIVDFCGKGALEINYWTYSSHFNVILLFN